MGSVSEFVEKQRWQKEAQDALDALSLEAVTRHQEVVDRLNAESAMSLQ